MADDIDDLLDEVETKYCAKGKEKHLSKRTRKNTDDDIDAILDDITVDTDFKPLKISEVKVSSHARPESAHKCFPGYLGGSDTSTGLTTTVNRKACDQLRCTSCDFKVVFFDNFEWAPTTDYLFLRNNAPDFHRLKSKLRSRKGYRAYCCQCCHKSIKEIVSLNNTDLKWVCGKH